MKGDDIMNNVERNLEIVSLKSLKDTILTGCNNCGNMSFSNIEYKNEVYGVKCNKCQKVYLEEKNPFIYELLRSNDQSFSLFNSNTGQKTTGKVKILGHKYIDHSDHSTK